MKKIRLALAAALVASVATVAPMASPSVAPTAEAGWLCDNTGVCGVVYNQPNSSCSLLVSNGWNGGLAGTIQRVKPGRADRFRDADGFDSLAGCHHRYSFNGGLTWSRWTTKAVKVNDATTALVHTKVKPKRSR